MLVVTIVGARPQFVKAAAISRVLREQHQEILVHTGQHYDKNMSDVFFEELDIPKPDINLGVGSGSHGSQTGAMLAGIETVLLERRPDWLLVYGDTNSTLAGALAAAKLHVPVVHVEAGLRSFKREMPEEINRVLTDHVATLLLCPSQVAVDHLSVEGIRKGVLLVGDVMSDVLHLATERAKKRTSIVERLGLSAEEYLLATVHRPENTDNPARLKSVFAAFRELKETIVFPIHPRTRKMLAAAGCALPPNVRALDPVGYLDMVSLEKSARAILTDSGGIQKEAYWLGVPCVTLRDETEWVETVASGWNTLTGVNTEQIVAAARAARKPTARPELYGDGQVARRCVAALKS
ncbi:MAG TPA: UDP-N-acetylglucosamine 2-epimerase (non-hydrolyzing) [Planctomycetota bacterium]|jgi:UDP-N-acetylglucosamine 2-epimerase